MSKVINGTYYHNETSDQIIEILEKYRHQNNNFPNPVRLRLYYGDTKTGKCWNETNDMIGYIGRSCGTEKIPILIKRLTMSHKKPWKYNFLPSGTGILDHCIVKIDITQKGYKPLYIHPSFHTGTIIINPITDQVLLSQGYTFSININGENFANFKNLEKAEKFKDFLEGKRYSL